MRCQKATKPIKLIKDKGRIRLIYLGAAHGEKIQTIIAVQHVLKLVPRVKSNISDRKEGRKNHRQPLIKNIRKPKIIPTI